MLTPTMPIKIPLWKRPWLWSLLFFLAAAVMLLLLAAKIFLGGAVPDYEGRLQLQGLEAPVTVTWDKWGTPHVKAQNEADLFLAYGWVVASERLFQMDLQRRVGRGELSEILGDKTLEVDKFFRTLKFAHWSREFFEANQEKLNPQMMRLLQSFLNGVNQFVQKGPLPLEMELLKYRPSPFHMEDILSYGAVMGFHFQEAPRTDPLKTFIWGEIGGERAQDLWPGEKQKVLSHMRQKMKAPLQLLTGLQVLPEWLPFEGSNAWVLAGKRTESGKPILANDPHIGFSQPGTWFEAHLSAPGFEVYGHHVPLIPFALLGHNQHHAWGLTMSEVDDMDFYREKLQPEDQNKVLYKGIWTELKQSGEKIKVKNKEDVILGIRESKHGPIVDHLLEPKVQMPQGELLSLSWPFLSLDNFMLETFFDLPRLTHVRELPKALEKAVGPGLNVLYADVDDQIAWYVLGKILKRPLHVDAQTLLDGTSSADEPLGFLPFSENPFALNPASGVIVSANDYPREAQNLRGPPLSGYWQGPQRYNRISELLSEKEKWSVEALKAVQTDSVLKDGPEMLALMLPLLEKKLVKDGVDEKILTLLREWKGEHTVDSAAALIFWQWVHQLVGELWSDDLGPRFAAYQDGVSSWQALKKVLQKPQSPLWDWLPSQGAESAEDVLFFSYTKMKEKLGPLGKNPAHWRWGKKHQITFKHAFGKMRPLNYLFNVGPFEVSGGNFQVNHMKFSRSRDESFDVFHGPSTRRLIDLGDLGKSVGILPSGNSGHALGPHYQDQAKLFLQNQYRPQFLNQAQIDAHKEGEVTFVP